MEPKMPDNLQIPHIATFDIESTKSHERLMNGSPSPRAFDLSQTPTPREHDETPPHKHLNPKHGKKNPVLVQNLPTKIGNPAPIGLFAFGMTTMMLMFKDAGWTDPEFTSMVFGYALFYGGVAQMIAGFFELYKGSTFAATAFVSYGAFWMGWYMMSFYKEPGQDFDTGFTLYFVQWGVFSTCMFSITVLTKCWALKVTFGLLSVTFFLLAGGVYSVAVSKAAGYVGFITGVAAFYTGLAEVYEAETDIKFIGL